MFDFAPGYNFNLAFTFVSILDTLFIFDINITWGQANCSYCIIMDMDSVTQDHSDGGMGFSNMVHGKGQMSVSSALLFLYVYCVSLPVHNFYKWA